MGDKAWPRLEEYIMLEQGNGGRGEAQDSFVGEVAFEPNLER